MDSAPVHLQFFSASEMVAGMNLVALSSTKPADELLIHST